MITYTSLVEDVPPILMAENRGLTDRMPLIIRQAEDEVFERLDHDAFRTILTPPPLLASGDGRIDLTSIDPPVFEVRAVRVIVDGRPIPIERRDIEFLNAVFTNVADGIPRYYAEHPTPLEFQVFPAPDADYPLEVTVNQHPPRLGSGRQENILTRQYGRLFEMTVLKRASMFMRNPTDEQRYEAAVGESLAGANAQIARRRRDETGTQPSKTTNRSG